MEKNSFILSHRFAFISILLFLISAISFGQEKSSVDIYIAGKLAGDSLEHSTACYWKNGLRTDLQLGAEPTAMCLVGNDLFISGNVTKDSAIKPCYWKNGKEYDLPCEKDGYTTSIAVMGKDVYIAGNCTKNSISIVCYWLNGKKVDFASAENSYSRSIFVSGKDVYISGFFTTKENDKNKMKACYWKNGNRSTLKSIPDFYSIATSIMVSDNDIYIAGKYGDGSQDVGFYSLNGNITKLISLDNSIIDKIAARATINEPPDILFLSYEEGYGYKMLPPLIEMNSLFVSGRNVYIVGTHDDGNGNRIPCYWENGNKKDLAKKGGSADAISIFPLKDDLFILGNDDGICYWENNTQIKVGAGYAIAFIVKQK